MVSIASLLQAIDERTIADQVAIPHDETRMRYPLASNRVSDFDEFARIISDYLIFHYGSCVTNGGTLSAVEATSRAKEILTRNYQRRNGDIITAFNDARDGSNGGLRGILDVLADSIKAEAVERYVRDMFDRHVRPNSWDDKVEIIRQFIDHVGAHNLPGIDPACPERYARDFESLIRGYTAGMQRFSSIFRRF